MKASKNYSNSLNFVSEAREGVQPHELGTETFSEDGTSHGQPPQVLESCLLPAQTSTCICIRTHHSQRKCVYQVIESNPCKNPRGLAGQECSPFTEEETEVPYTSSASFMALSTVP